MNSVLGEITLIQIANLGKIKFMSLKVDGKRLVRFAGPNEAGKSTVLDRLQNLFESASKVPEGIIRNGIYHEGREAGKRIDRGMARIETSNGYVIEQIVRKTKDDKQKAELKVTHNGMPVQGGPLGFLQSVSTKYPDPHKVANLSEKELFTELFSILGIDLSSYDEKIEQEKERAREARAKLKMLGAEKARPEGPEPAPISEDEYFETRKELDVEAEVIKTLEQQELRAHHLIDNKNEEIKKNLEEIGRLKAMIIDLENRNDAAADEITEATNWMKENPIDRTKLDELERKVNAYLHDIQTSNAWKEYTFDRDTRMECQEILDDTKAAVSAISEEKSRAVIESNVPATDIYIREDGSVLRKEEDEDLHWDTLSMSARLTAATELCISSIPENSLRALYVERGESIGTRYRNVIAKLAAEKDVQVFMEVFTESAIEGDGVFMLEEGEIIEKDPEEAFEEYKRVTEADSREPEADSGDEQESPFSSGEPEEEKFSIGVKNEETLDLF